MQNHEQQQSRPGRLAASGPAGPGEIAVHGSESRQGMTSRGRGSSYKTVRPATVGRLRLLRANGIGIDPDGRRVFADGTEVQLPPKEFDLLYLLLKNAGRAISRRQLLDTVWGPGYPDGNKTLDQHVRRLRRKLDPGSRSPRIRTVRGLGYVLDVETTLLTGPQR
jgi:DNA-binding response OmpR family regulator